MFNMQEIETAKRCSLYLIKLKKTEMTYWSSGVALDLKFLGSMKIFADPFESAKDNF